MAKSEGGKLVERIASSDPISDTLPAALPETESVDGNLAEDCVSARENLAALFSQRKVGADVAGAADSVGNAFCGPGSEGYLCENDDLNDALMAVEQKNNRYPNDELTSVEQFFRTCEFPSG